MTDIAQGADKVATFAGGCFWCMQAPFDKVAGVKKTIVGYTGGRAPNPNYETVSSGQTGHVEAIEVHYDSSKVNFKKLLDVFWHNIDPENGEGQFCDTGPQYRAVIFYDDALGKAMAERSRDELIQTQKIKAVKTEFHSSSTFFPAEEYHQDYYKKNPVRYKFYRFTCGRDRRLKALWGGS